MTKLHDFGCGVSILGIQNSDDFRLKVGLKEILKVLEMKEFGDAKNWAHFYKIEIKVI